MDWRSTFFVRSNGEVIGAAENQIPLPTNAHAIMRATCVMQSSDISQSGFWFGPRLFISTLHLQNWNGPFASFDECEKLRQSGAAFAVEGEISRHVLTKYSPHAQLVAFDINNDLGIFRLQNQYPDQKDFVDINWLLEREEAYHNQLPVHSKAACCGFSASVSEQASREIQSQAAHHLSKVPLAAVSFY